MLLSGYRPPMFSTRGRPALPHELSVTAWCRNESAARPAQSSLRRAAVASRETAIPLCRRRRVIIHRYGRVVNVIAPEKAYPGVTRPGYSSDPQTRAPRVYRSDRRARVRVPTVAWVVARDGAAACRGAAAVGRRANSAAAVAAGYGGVLRVRARSGIDCVRH
eukprot:359854-Chlamydomonas_euryale.AAC.5